MDYVTQEQRKILGFPQTHRHTGTFGLGGGGAVIFLPEKNYAMPECVILETGIQMYSGQIT